MEQSYLQVAEDRKRSTLWLFAVFSDVLIEEYTLGISEAPFAGFLQGREPRINWEANLMHQLLRFRVVDYDYREGARPDSLGRVQSVHALPKRVYRLNDFGFEVLGRIDVDKIIH